MIEKRQLLLTNSPHSNANPYKTGRHEAGSDKERATSDRKTHMITLEFLIQENLTSHLSMYFQIDSVLCP